MKQAKDTYINPYLGGFILGLVIMLVYFVGGHGIGFTGAFKNFLIVAWNNIIPETSVGNLFFTPTGTGLFNSWIVIMFLGVVFGGFLSGFISKRLYFRIEKGKRISNKVRLLMALAGGLLFGIGSQIARGCTSGAALNGMAVLSASGIITMLAIFIAGFSVAYIFKRLWV